jgi:putative hydrolase of the HAD superfamily
MQIEPDKYRAVVFDLDGTLYDNKGLPMRLILSDIPNMFVLGAERKARRLLSGKDYGDAAGVYDTLFATMAAVKSRLTVEKARRWYQDKYMPMQVTLLYMYYEPRPLAAELLQAIKARGLKCYLYSDYGHEVEKVTALGLDKDLFDGIVSAAKMGGLKPSRPSMERMQQLFGLDAETTLYVGDREDTDGESARAVGMPFVNVKASPEAWDELLKAFL